MGTTLEGALALGLGGFSGLAGGFFSKLALAWAERCGRDRVGILRVAEHGDTFEK